MHLQTCHLDDDGRVLPCPKTAILSMANMKRQKHRIHARSGARTDARTGAMPHVLAHAQAPKQVPWYMFWHIHRCQNRCQNRCHGTRFGTCLRCQGDWCQNRVPHQVPSGLAPALGSVNLGIAESVKWGIFESVKLGIFESLDGAFLSQ